MPRRSKDRRFFTTSEIARHCEVSNDGVLKWIKAGKLRAFATPGGHYRVSTEDFRAFLQRYDFPLFDETEPRRTRILVVDDEETVREILRRRLRAMDADWKIDEASDGYEAGILIGSLRPEVVILDLMMPRVDGLSLCRSIRAHPETASIAIVAITGSADPELRKRALAAGADACLSKPIDFERLQGEVHKLLRRRLAAATGSARVSAKPRSRGLQEER